MTIDPDALGPCGCVDYHMADCPLVTDRLNPPDPPEPDDDGPDFEPEDD